MSLSINASQFDSNSAKLCNATWNPNYIGSLDKCDLKCKDGFECRNGFCCPTKGYVCKQPADSGHEINNLEHDGRFYYDHELGNCMKFSFFGASTSFNNFVKYIDCKRFCSEL